MTEVIKHTDFDVSKITGTKPTARGGKKDKLTAYLLYDNSPFLLKLPALKAPFGVTSYNNNGVSSNNYSLNLSAKSLLNKDVDKQEELNKCVVDIYDQLEQLDKFMISYGLEYSKSIFGKEYEAGKHDAVVEALFTSTVKSSDDKDGNPYPRRINTKIRSQYEQPDKPNVKVYKGSREDLNDDDFTFDSFEDLIQKGSFVEGVIQPGLWFMMMMMMMIPPPVQRMMSMEKRTMQKVKSQMMLKIRMRMKNPAMRMRTRTRVEKK